MTRPEAENGRGSPRKNSQPNGFNNMRILFFVRLPFSTVSFHFIA
jgi:hypothetical protein